MMRQEEKRSVARPSLEHFDIVRRSLLSMEGLGSFTFDVEILTVGENDESLKLTKDSTPNVDV